MSSPLTSALVAEAGRPPSKDPGALGTEANRSTNVADCGNELNRRKFVATGVAGAAFAGVSLQGARAQGRGVPDLILHGGRIYTADARDSVASAVAIADGRIVAVGSDESVLPAAGPNTRKVQLDGRTVTPGFIDGHPHMEGVGSDDLRPSWGPLRSIDDVLAVVRREVAKLAPGEWLVMPPMIPPPQVFAYPEAFRERRWPDRFDLDKAAPNNPVYIEANFMAPPGVSIGNSAAWATAEPPPGWSPPPGVTIERDAAGALTGRIIDYNYPRRGPNSRSFGAQTGFPKVPLGRDADPAAALKRSMQLFNAAGLTAVYEGHGMSLRTIDTYKALHRQGLSTVRAYLPLSFGFGAYSNPQEREAVLRQAAQIGPGNGVGDDLLKIGGLGFSFDSAAAAGKCLMREPYTAPDGVTSRGVQLTSDANLRDAIFAAGRAGLRVQVQCSGGLAIDKVLAIFQEFDRETPIRERRWVIEHCQFPSAENMAVCARLGVIPTTCATFLWDYGSVYLSSFGEAVADQAIPFRSWLEAGLPVVNGTDGHPYEPMFVFWQLLARQDGHTRRVLGPDQTISRAQALRTYTINGARAAFWENEIGSIEPGKLADLAILSQDIMTIDRDKIPETKVVSTLLSGHPVHDTGFFS